jgi:hypothetical protein
MGCGKSSIQGIYVNEKGKNVIDFRKKYCFIYSNKMVYPYEIVGNYVYIHFKDEEYDFIYSLKIEDKNTLVSIGSPLNFYHMLIEIPEKVKKIK